MQCLHSLKYLTKDTPKLRFWEVGLSPFVLSNLAKKVTIIAVLHHNAKCVGLVIDKGFLVLHDIRMRDRSQNSNFVQGVFSFFSF
jgi:hypothetical protein